MLIQTVLEIALATVPCAIVPASSPKIPFENPRMKRPAEELASAKRVPDV
jgi:hypothetical protein